MEKKAAFGITGPMGSGKTALAAAFEERGLAVIDADILARKVLSPGSEAMREAVRAFGADILAADGTLDRPLLASRAFADGNRIEILNGIVHPRVRKMIIEEMEKQPDMKWVLDVPLLFESGFDAICDKTIYVKTPFAVRAARLRGRFSEEEIRGRERFRLDEEVSIRKADIVIDNTGDLEDLSEMVVRIMEENR